MKNAHYKIFALENTPAQLCAGQATCSDDVMKNLIVAEYERRGLVVNVECEE